MSWLNDLVCVSITIHRASLSHLPSFIIANDNWAHLSCTRSACPRLHSQPILISARKANIGVLLRDIDWQAPKQDPVLSYVRHKLLWQGDWLGFCRILYFSFGLCERRGVLRFFCLSLLLATAGKAFTSLLSIRLHGTTEPALWVSSTDYILGSSVGQAFDIAFASAGV